ncbi:hypothetical protein P8C59_000171 [Phyllachora maydis]|uniref:Uncharacterized protein n=1 Tax=Phyllachora maydis TaxID=1825666 RepID=A0AAD9HX35_9PEZI|nr:hypothetical protein P8C59_000171 [Phyllachora maydis]
MQLDYYKLLAKTSSYILSFVYKARKRVISRDSTPTTYKQVLKLPRDERSKYLLPSNHKLITCQNVLKVKKDAKNRPIKYKSRPLTTTSTTIVDSRNSKVSSRTSIINSSLVPIGFSNSDFTGDKAISKSTYGYLYKLASRPISWKTKRATTIALFTLEAETDGLEEAIREVQWIIGLFSELHRPIDHPITLYRDNEGSITVANNPALYARTKHTLLKFRYVREQVKAKIVTIIYLNTNNSNNNSSNSSNSS